MQCSMCGREITNPNANYCDYCGTAVGAAAYREVQPQQQTTNGTVQKPERVSTWLFLGIMCLPFVPFVGSIAYLVFLFYWAFAPSIEDSRKSFARATLIYTGITLVLSFIIIGFIFAGVMNGLGEML
ncbi:MAG: zinc-ribbon domain-containing protein [Lachnospiraceae bacterium]|nr:zinc-ribbon domain-containing protein [Lachnospiraceae bacterium]